MDNIVRIRTITEGRPRVIVHYKLFVLIYYHPAMHMAAHIHTQKIIKGKISISVLSY